MRKLYIDNEWIASEAAEEIEVTTPADGNETVIDTVPDGSETDIKRTVEAARKAEKALCELTVYERAELVYAVRDYLADISEEIASTITKEEGKPIQEARMEVRYTVESAESHADDAFRLYGNVIPSESKGRFAFTTRESYGPCAIITPWNYPLELPAENAFAAILTANPVMLKPSEETPLAAYHLAEAFEAVGAPEGTFNLVTGGEDTGGALVSHPDVGLISFTGSVETGQEITRQSAGHTPHLHLEMGGKDPVLVVGDADIEWAADRIVYGSNANAGQVCCGTERVIATDDVYDALLDEVTRRTESLRIGDPFNEDTDVGPMINDRIQSKVVDHVDQAVSAGGTIHTGGSVEDQYYEPAVVGDVDPDSALAQEETFGPVTPFIRASDLDEAIEIANETKYGLQAAVFTRDIEVAFEAVNRIKAGGVFINESDNYWESGLPFGGHKQSGTGRIGNLCEEMTQTKSAIINYRDA